MRDLAAILDDAALHRLTNRFEAHRLALGALEPGQAGVVHAVVQAVAPLRTYARKRGGEGLLARVTLADETGEADLVLWDEQTALTRTGPLQPGRRIRLHGPTVKAGHRGGVELALGAAVVVDMPEIPPIETQPIEGWLTSIGEVRPIGKPPVMRFSCDLTIATRGGVVCIVAWDDAVKQAHAAGLQAYVRIPEPAANPFLDGWWTTAQLNLASQPPAGPPLPPLAATHK